MRGRTAFVALTVCVATAQFTAAQHVGYATHAAVFVHVTTADDIRGQMLNGMRQEATRIWARHRVTLTWGYRQPPTTSLYQAIVPVIFDDGLTKKWPDGDKDALARTIFSGRTQTIYVSMQRAWQMLRAFHGTIPGLETEDGRQLRAGVLVGRVVAHELGHVLLTSVQHSADGLMRAIFGLGDVVSNEDRLVALSPSQSARLIERFSLRDGVPGSPVLEQVLARHPVERLEPRR
jgi:hypothetical protein